MPANHFKIKSKVWVYPGMAGWRFLSLPKKHSTKIQKIFGDLARGWGSLPVNVTVGATKWKTLIFPDKKTKTYILPLKTQVRKTENIKDKDLVNFSIEIVI